MRTCVIFNPTARGNKARHFRAHLHGLAGECAWKPTTGPGAALGLAVDAVREGFDAVVAAGGDGTVNEVANGLAQSPGGLERVRLGILPLGTINVFARELGLPGNLDDCWQIIRAGHETRVDLPRAEYTLGGKPVSRCLVQLGGAGLDARAIGYVDWEWKQRIGPLAYMTAGLKALLGPQPQVRVQSAEADASGELVLIGNGRFYGGSVPLFPEGNLRDGQLEVRVFPRVRVLTLARFGWAWLWDQPFAVRGEIRFRTTALTLTSAVPMPFELDGDNVGELPARFTIQREALRVLVPNPGE